MLHHENFIFSKNYAQTKPEDTAFNGHRGAKIHKIQEVNDDES